MNGLKKERKKIIESYDELPEDLRKSIMDIHQKGIDIGEKRLREIKKKL